MLPFLRISGNREIDFKSEEGEIGILVGLHAVHRLERKRRRLFRLQRWFLRHMRSLIFADQPYCQKCTEGIATLRELFPHLLLLTLYAYMHNN